MSNVKKSIKSYRIMDQKISEFLASTVIASEVSIEVFETDVPSAFIKGVDKNRQTFDDLNTMIMVQNKIRKAVASANQDLGINDLMTQRGMVNNQIQALASFIGKGEPSPNSPLEFFEARKEVRISSITNGNVLGRRSAQITIPSLDAEVLEKEKKELRQLKVIQRGISEKLTELNLVNTIDPLTTEEYTQVLDLDII